MTHTTPDPLRDALAFYADDANWRQNGPLDPNSANFTGGPARAALAATPQPAPAPVADERAEIERIICDAFTCDLRGRGDEDGAFWQTAADALLAAGYRKADALLAERDALIHDIERAKESETALLAERDAARAEGYRQGQENMRSRIASPLFLRPLVDKQSAGEWYEETLAADTQMYADAILAVPLAPEGSS